MTVGFQTSARNTTVRATSRFTLVIGLLAGSGAVAQVPSAETALPPSSSTAAPSPPQTAPSAPTNSQPVNTGFNVQTPSGGEPMPVLPMPIGTPAPPSGTGGNAIAPNSNALTPAFAPAPKPTSSNLKSEIQAYDPTGGQRPILIMKTSEGEFKIRLNRTSAPRNVDNFFQLALGTKDFVDVRTGKKVRRPFYTGLTCHRVIKGFLIQCGCPYGNGHGGPGYTEKDEFSLSQKIDRPGIVAMSPQYEETTDGRKPLKNSNGSQFFISLGAMPELNDQATIIGEVTSGMETIKRIAATPTGPTDRPIKRVMIFSVDPEVITPMPGPGIDPFKN